MSGTPVCLEIERKDFASTRLTDVSDVFVCSDDFGAAQELDAEIRQRGVGMRVRSLVEPQSSGFDWEGMMARGEVMSAEDTQSVLFDLMICANSSVFVGADSSAVFRFISNVHRDDSQYLDVGW